MHLLNMSPMPPDSEMFFHTLATCVHNRNEAKTATIISYVLLRNVCLQNHSKKTKYVGGLHVNVLIMGEQKSIMLHASYKLYVSDLIV